jgi:hypothetical protein
VAPPDPRAALDGLARLGVPGPVAVELLELQAASVSSPVTLQANSANLVLVRTRFLPENMGPRLFVYPYRRFLTGGILLPRLPPAPPYGSMALL